MSGGYANGHVSLSSARRINQVFDNVACKCVTVSHLHSVSVMTLENSLDNLYQSERQNLPLLKPASSSNKQDVLVLTEVVRIHHEESLVAEDVGVKTPHCVRGDEGTDEGQGPDSHQGHTGGAAGSQGGVPLWGPGVAWKQSQTGYIPTNIFSLIWTSGFKFPSTSISGWNEHELLITCKGAESNCNTKTSWIQLSELVSFHNSRNAVKLLCLLNFWSSSLLPMSSWNTEELISK